MWKRVVFTGLPRTPCVDAMIDRWIMRIDTFQGMASYEVSIRVERRPWGLSKRAVVDVAVTGAPGALHLVHAATFRDRDDLYPLLADTFRDVHQQLHALSTRRTQPSLPVITLQPA